MEVHLHEDMKKVGLERLYASNKNQWNGLQFGRPDKMNAYLEWNQLCPLSCAELKCVCARVCLNDFFKFAEISCALSFEQGYCLNNC